MDNSVVLDETKAQRIHQLETLLQEYKSTNEQLSTEIDSLGGSSSTLGQGRTRQELSFEIEKERLEKMAVQKGKMAFLNDILLRCWGAMPWIDLERIEAESKQNINRIEELEQSLFDLSGEIAGGRHVPPNVRILSMKDNPEQEWFDLRQAAMDRLKGENQALMKRLKELEESGVKSTHNMDDGERRNTELVPRESWELVNREKKELEDTVKQKEKRLLRLQQVLSTKNRYYYLLLTNYFLTGYFFL
jgi:mitotic spindle assembly checkpoint protein MAD1